MALYFAECATDFTMSFGDIDEEFYDTLGDAYHDAVVIASEDECLYQMWKVRLETVLHDFVGLDGEWMILLQESIIQYHGLRWNK